MKHTILVLVALLVGAFTFVASCKLGELSDQEYTTLKDTLHDDAYDLAYAAVKERAKTADDLLIVAGALVRIDPDSQAYSSAMDGVEFKNVAIQISLRHIVQQLSMAGTERAKELAQAVAEGIVAGIEKAKQPPKNEE